MFVRCFAVSPVFTVASKPKVGDAIVGFVPIDMINLLLGPLFVDKKPSEAMTGIANAINFNVAIAFVLFHITGFIANLNFRTRRRPYENPGFRVIMKDLEKFFMFDHVGILPEHEADYNRKIA
jgi:hypothetical protein